VTGFHEGQASKDDARHTFAASSWSCSVCTYRLGEALRCPLDARAGAVGRPTRPVVRLEGTHTREPTHAASVCLFACSVCCRTCELDVETEYDDVNDAGGRMIDWAEFKKFMS